MPFSSISAADAVMLVLVNCATPAAVSAATDVAALSCTTNDDAGGDVPPVCVAPLNIAVHAPVSSSSVTSNVPPTSADHVVVPAGDAKTVFIVVVIGPGMGCPNWSHAPALAVDSSAATLNSNPKTRIVNDP